MASSAEITPMSRVRSSQMRLFVRSSSYSEIFVSDVCWPDFGKDQLHEVFRDYGRRVRKFGQVL